MSEVVPLPVTKEFTPVKVLLLGDQGAGKTGSTVSLAKAGYNLRIMDFDNGTEIIRNLLTPEEFKRCSIVTLQDHRKAERVPVITGGTISNYMLRAMPKATSWQKAIDLVFHWKNGADDFGSIYDWTSNEVLVLDSMTHMWHAAMNYILAINNRLGQNPTQPEWGTCQGMILDVLATFFDASIKCNIVCCSHIAYDKDQREILHGLPSGPGSAINKEIGTYFNHTIRAATVGLHHTLLTQSDGVVELKNPAPGTVKGSYPIETGLADYFKTVRKPLG